MPAVMIQAAGRAPARARRRPPTRWSRVPPAVPLDPQPVVSGWNPCPPFAFERRDCRSVRGGRAVRPPSRRS